MNADRQKLISWLDLEQGEIISLFKDLIQAPSPNPPGNTLKAAEVITKFLSEKGLEYRIIDPCAEMPNVVAAFDAPSAGKHLVLNGHIDVFPVSEGNRGWTKDPWEAV